MRKMTEMLSVLESRNDPDIRQIESLLYIYADMPVRSEGSENGAGLFDELTRLANLCERCGFPDEVLIFCYKRALFTVEPDIEQVEKYGIRLIKLYTELCGSFEPDDEDKECAVRLLSLLQKYSAELTSKKDHIIDQDMLEIYEAGLYRILLESTPPEERKASLLFSTIILCARAGYNRMASKEKAQSYWETAERAFALLPYAALRDRTGKAGLICEIAIESAALAFEELAVLIPEEEWITSLVYYQKAMALRLKYMDRVSAEDISFYLGSRYNRLRMILRRTDMDVGIIAEFADGFLRLHEAFKGIRKKIETDRYQKLSDEFYDLTIKRNTELTADEEPVSTEPADSFEPC